jgi:heme-degrading monooxygenase HmoA
MAFYTLSPKAHDEGKEDVIRKLDASVKSMVGKVPGLIHAEVKLNLSESPHDLIFYSEFERMEDIAPYLRSDIHAAHAAMADGYVENKEGADVEV